MHTYTLIYMGIYIYTHTCLYTHTYNLSLDSCKANYDKTMVVKKKKTYAEDVVDKQRIQIRKRKK